MGTKSWQLVSLIHSDINDSVPTYVYVMLQTHVMGHKTFVLYDVLLR